MNLHKCKDCAALVPIRQSRCLPCTSRDQPRRSNEGKKRRLAASNRVIAAARAYLAVEPPSKAPAYLALAEAMAELDGRSIQPGKPTTAQELAAERDVMWRALRVIADWRAHHGTDYDDDVGYPRRSFGADDIPKIEACATRALDEVWPGPRGQP